VIPCSATRFAGAAEIWTTENRSLYDRSKLRYSSDLMDDEWAFISPLIPAAKRGGNKRTVARVRRNMKRLPVSFLDKALLNGRNIVETIIGHI